MTRLKGTTPTPAQAAAAYRAHFQPALDQAGGKDGRISRASAARMAEREDAGKLLADNLENFFEATGQKSVSARRFGELVEARVERSATRAAGSNQRLSLVEIRSLPQDIQADLLHLRGKDGLAAPAPAVAFNENDLYAFEPWSWTPAHRVNSGEVSHDGSQVVLTNLSPVPAELQPVVSEVLTFMWDASIKYRAMNGQPEPLGPRGAGELKMGPIVDAESGKSGMLVYWQDIDDASFAWFYEKTDQGYQQRHQVFLN